MIEDKLAFLSAPQRSQPETLSDGGSPAQNGEVLALSDASASPAPERGADGRFAPHAPEAGAALEQASAPTPPVAAASPTPEPGQVPISALLDEREKRQAAEKARADYERQLHEYRARSQPAAPVDPNQAMQDALYSQNLRACRRFAEREHTPELVQTVHDWAAKRCDEDPRFNEQMRSSDDPYEAAIRAYQREQVLEAVQPAELDDFRAWKAQRAAASAQAPITPPSPAPRAPVPRSLATAAGNGGAGVSHVPIGPGQAFGATFK
jgi:hypothetical protein